MNTTEQLQPKFVKESRAVKSSYVLPPDTNNYRTLFGGKLMAYIDDIAAISAIRHARKQVVTASTDSVDFLHPIKEGQSVCLESFVTWTHKTSMEVFVKVIAEELLTGDRKICATSFLTFVALGEDGIPAPVPKVIPESPEEIELHNTAPRRAEARRIRRIESQKFAQEFGVKKPWE
ncbi:acyl-CoA thioesterase [Caldalkalibacillus mannanilyticus]|uniref:acyl-CoA thioesterase n=1 Tax=Caldalkalibacillus mannanilyticus TaxID=1418 RepID=UPI000469653A|nr:acyl-CoA thioesterase [Caldalkalibacillus mannanilyticus]